MKDRKKKLQSRLKSLQETKEKKDESLNQKDLEEIDRLKLLQKVEYICYFTISPYQNFILHLQFFYV